jgi:hypothetical protein
MDRRRETNGVGQGRDLVLSMYELGLRNEPTGPVRIRKLPNEPRRDCRTNSATPIPVLRNEAICTQIAAFCETNPLANPHASAILRDEPNSRESDLMNYRTNPNGRLAAFENTKPFQFAIGLRADRVGLWLLSLTSYGLKWAFLLS